MKIKKEMKNYTEISRQAPIKLVQQILKEIDPQEFYTPLEITRAGWIHNTMKKPDYMFLLNKIRGGMIKAKHTEGSDKGKPRYLVSGKDLLIFLKEKYS